MKVLKQLLFAAAVMICFSMTASAQDDKKPKPKPTDKPIIQVVHKNDDKNKPKENDKPREDKKKPESAYLKSSNGNEIEVV